MPWRNCLNSTELASARTPTCTSCLRLRQSKTIEDALLMTKDDFGKTYLTYKSPKKERLASCMCTGQVCTEHRHLHHSFVAAARAPAWASHRGFYGNEHLALAETRVLGFSSSSQGTWTCWSNREISFLFGSVVSAIVCENLFLQFFSKLLSLSVVEGFECVCYVQEEKFPAACRTILHVFSSFLQSRRQSENFTLAESWRNGFFCL